MHPSCNWHMTLLRAILYFGLQLLIMQLEFQMLACSCLWMHWFLIKILSFLDLKVHNFCVNKFWSRGTSSCKVDTRKFFSHENFIYRLDLSSLFLFVCLFWRLHECWCCSALYTWITNFIFGDRSYLLELLLNLLALCLLCSGC